MSKQLPWNQFVDFAKVFGFDLEGGIDLGNGQRIGVQMRPETAAERRAKAQASKPEWAKVLGVKSGWHTLSREQLNQRRRDLAKRYHPDQAKGKEAEARAQKMRKINDAFEQACKELGL